MDRLATTAPVTPGGTAVEPAIKRGMLLGRYVVERQLGEGGMGAVWAALDPELGRRVAVKALHASYAAMKQGLLREGQAIARLRHPNVITVHDIGTHGDGLFIAMELVDGTTLSGWLAAATRSERDIVDAFIAAGRGLAAAHAAGLVHRDVKPDNVLVGHDGRIVVTDFGLARRSDAEADAAQILDPPSEPPAELALDETQTGSIAGTPAYMSPEQFHGGAVDARSDQFSFCVALYEALHGSRPFRGATFDALRASVLFEDPARLASVSARVWRAIATGLAKLPAERHASMDALLAELAPAPELLSSSPSLAGMALPPPPSRRRVVVTGIAVVVAAAAAAAAIAVAIVGAHHGEPAPTKPVTPYAVTKLAVPISGIAGPGRLASDGASIQFTDANGSWSYDLAHQRVDRVSADPRTRTSTFVSESSTGAVAFEMADAPGHIGLIDTHGAELAPPITGISPEWSPDGRRLVAYDGTWLVRFDLETKTSTRIAELQGLGFRGPARWSADGRFVVLGGATSWDATRTPFVLVVEVATGAQHHLDLPLDRESPQVITPAAFLGDDRIVYCARDAKTVSIRARDMHDDAGTTEQTLATLDPSVTLCEMSTQGDRVLAEVVRHARRLNVMDTAAPIASRQLRELPERCAEVADVSAAGDAIYFYASPPGRLDGDAASRDLAADVVAPGEGVSHAVHTCDGDAGLVVRGTDLLHLARIRHDGGDDIIELRRDGGCTPAESWRVPHGAEWRRPIACRDHECVALRRDRDSVELWKLPAGVPRGRKLASLTAPSTGFNTSIDLAISPDDRWVAVRLGSGSSHAFVPLDGGPSRTFDLPGAQHLAWEDATHVLVAGLGILGQQYGLAEVSLDGTAPTLLWSSPTTWIGSMRYAPATHTLATCAVGTTQDFVLAEPRH